LIGNIRFNPSQSLSLFKNGIPMVHLKFFSLIVSSILLLAGCDGANRPVDRNPVSGGGEVRAGKPMEITWPGGSVTIGDEGVEVKAPGVDVSTAAGESVKVKTPTVDLEGRIERQ
jgi:uncharacterized lipoprotein